MIFIFCKRRKINYEKMGQLIEWHIENKTDAIIVCGTTGESSTMTDEERKSTIKFVVDKVNKRIPVIAGSGSNNTAYSIELSKYCQEVGADGLLIVTPYYNKATQGGLIKHYTAIANSVDLPIILYNVPGRTGANMSAETTLRLAEIDNVIAIKEASGNRGQVEEILRNAPEGFKVFSGNDDETLWMMENGGAGVISVASNVDPVMMAKLIKAIRGGYHEQAHALNEKLTPLFTNCFMESNPIPAKAALSAMGLIQNELRLPLVPAQEETYDLMVDTLVDLGLL